MDMEYEFSDYAVFDDAQNDMQNMNDQMTETKAGISEVKTVLGDSSVFMGPIADQCVTSLDESLSKLGGNIESFEKMEDYIDTASTNYKTGDEEASEMVTNADEETILPTTMEETSTNPSVVPVEESTTEKITETVEEPATTSPVVETPTQTTAESASYLKRMGRIQGPAGYQETWYSQKVLPGAGLNIPGRHVDANGFVCDGDGYIVIASPNLNAYPKGSTIQTSCGTGKVYDFCPEGSVDVYTDW